MKESRNNQHLYTNDITKFGITNAQSSPRKEMAIPRITIVLNLIIVLIIQIACLKQAIQEQALILTEQLESEHFLYFCEESDTILLEHFMSKLEDGYCRISEDLKFQLDTKIELEIYPNLHEFRKAVGIPNMPEWMIANSSCGSERPTIKIVSPNNPGPHHTAEFVKDRVMVYELTQIIIYMKVGHKPAIWLHKGLASYYGQNLTVEEIKQVISEDIKQNKVPSFNDLQPVDGNRVPEEAFNNLHGYEYSYTIVEYIITCFGFDHIRTLLAETEYPFDYQRIFQLTEEELYTQWVQYLQTNYVL